MSDWRKIDIRRLDMIATQIECSMRRGDTFTASELAPDIGCSPDDTKAALVMLVDDGAMSMRGETFTALKGTV